MEPAKNIKILNDFVGIDSIFFIMCIEINLINFTPFIMSNDVILLTFFCQ